MMATLFVLLLWHCNLCVGQGGDVKDIYIMGLFPMEGMWSGGESMMIAAQMGMDHVNQRTDILPGYKLNLVWDCTKVRVISHRLEIVKASFSFHNITPQNIQMTTLYTSLSP